MKKQPIEVQTLYAELLERLAALEAHRSIGNVPGSFVLKTIKGGEYYYFQYLEPGGAKRQAYIGRRSEALDAVAERHAEGRAASEPDVADIERLSALLRAGGALVTDTPSARVLRSLADSGVFRLGGVVVGKHAFIALGNVLGVRWDGSGMRTRDVDIAAEARLSVVVQSEHVDIPGVLESLDRGFLPVPALARDGNSTSFKVRGQGLRVDMLTPAVRAGQRDIRIPWLNSWAAPLKYLDYATEDVITAAIINGGATSVNVPAPATFALHKLLVANERPAAMHAKHDKDLWQAAQVLEVLAEERRGDVIIAWERLAARGPSWERKALAGLQALETTARDVAAQVRALVKGGS